MQQMTMRVTAPIGRPTLAVTERPPIEQLQVWWEAMQSDDLSVAYADSFPPTLAHFRHEVAQGEKILLLGLVDGQVAGTLWLHDLLHRHDGSVAAGWFGCYFLPSYRGRPAIQLWQAALQHWKTAGIAHFFSAIHVANRRSQAYATRGGSFHRIGRFPAFTVFQGQPADVFIYTLYAEDTALAWELAAARAARQMPSTARCQSSYGFTCGGRARQAADALATLAG
jgi:RimJ/RimL family protein N-acetyltransferase